MNRALQYEDPAPSALRREREKTKTPTGGLATVAERNKPASGDTIAAATRSAPLRIADSPPGKVDFSALLRAGAHADVNADDMPATSNNLALLASEADSLLLRLARLRRSLREMREDIRELSPSGTLAETNRELFITALHAEDVAAAAVQSLAQVARASQHDALTHLPNRLLMIDRLQNTIASAKRHEARFALLFIDLDNFKRVNDTLGHAVGDQVLMLAARRLRGVVRDSDTVSRHGGEEFLVLLPDISSSVDAALVAEKLGAALAAPGRAGEHRLQLSASIGIAIFPEDGEDPQTLIGRADAAMYRAKSRGRGRYEFYAEKRSRNVRRSNSAS